MTNRKPVAQPAATPMVSRATVRPTYAKGSHAARVRAEQDERRVELLALHDVLSAQRDGLNDQLADIGEALGMLSAPASNVIAMAAE